MEHSTSFQNSQGYIAAAITSMAGWSIADWASFIGLVMGIILFVLDIFRRIRQKEIALRRMEIEEEEAQRKSEMDKRHEEREKELYELQIEKVRLQKFISEAISKDIDRRKSDRAIIEMLEVEDI